MSANSARTSRMFSLEGAAIVVGGLLSGPHYVASKGAVGALVRWFARLGAPRNVLANGVAPGPVRAPMIAGREVNRGAMLDVNGEVYMSRTPIPKPSSLTALARSAGKCRYLPVSRGRFVEFMRFK